MIALGIICDFASLRTCMMPDWLPWGNVGLRDSSRCHVLRGSPLIGRRSADARDGVASWLPRGLVLGMLTRTDVFRDMRTVNVNRRCECDFVTP